MELLIRVLQQPWGPVLLTVVVLEVLVLVAFIPWAFQQDRRRIAAWQAWRESLPGPLREAHRRSKPRVVAAQVVDLLEFFTTLGVEEWDRLHRPGVWPAASNPPRGRSS